MLAGPTAESWRAAVAVECAQITGSFLLFLLLLLMLLLLLYSGPRQ
jgi:hypothetical protein